MSLSRSKVLEQKLSRESRKRVRESRAVAIVGGVLVLAVLVGLVGWQQFYRPDSDPAEYRSTEEKSSARTVGFDELVGRSPTEAKIILGYPDHLPVKATPTIVAQDDEVDLKGKLIVTAVCFRPGADGEIVFEVANEGSLPEAEVNRLKVTQFRSRTENIKQQTGCESDFVGITVEP